MKNVAADGLRALFDAVAERGGRIQKLDRGQQNVVSISAPDGSTVESRVKSRTKGDWQGNKSIGIAHPAPQPGKYWVLVDLSVDPAEFYIVPAAALAASVAADVEQWATRHSGPTYSGHTKITTASVARWRGAWSEIGLAPLP